MFSFIKKLVNTATKPQQQQPNQNNNLSQPQNQNMVRQYLNVPNYDQRVLGIDVAPEVEMLKNILRGRRLDSKGKKYIYFNGSHEVINECGVEVLMGFHGFMLSMSNATTNLRDENRLRYMCEEYCGNILEIILSNDKEWQIDPSFFDYIIDTLGNHYEYFLRKSMNDGQRKYMHGMTEQPEQMPNIPFTA